MYFRPAPATDATSYSSGCPLGVIIKEAFRFLFRGVTWAFVFQSEERLPRSDISTQRNYAIRRHLLDPPGDVMPGVLHRQ